MCRHLAYLGPAASPIDLVVGPTHSLLAQCTDAREMVNGCHNLDGWGFAWFDESGRLVRYRTTEPLPSDRQGREQLASIRTDQFMVHARQKSPGAVTDVTGNAPFADGHWLFSHNGAVEGFRDGVREQLLGRLTPVRRGGIEGDTDSEVLFALVLDRLDAGAPPGEALAAIGKVADEFGGRYNVLLMGPTGFVATRWGNSLYVREAEAVTVASEPLDAGGAWRAVEDRSMLVVDRTAVGVEPW
jgi:glutamine amidotransferase